MLGCYVKQYYGPSFRLYDLFAEAGVKANSDETPALCQFNDRLFLAWKSAGHEGSIFYQRTAGDGVWLPHSRKLPYTTFAAPTMATFKNTLYLAWLTDETENGDSHKVAFITTTDGFKWTSPVHQRVLLPNGREKDVESPYPPQFSVYDDSLFVVWGAGPTRSQAVYVAPINFEQCTKASLIGGFLETSVGNAVAYQIGKQVLFSVSRQEIWCATGPEFCIVEPFLSENSLHAPAAVVVPGVPDDRDNPWTIFLVWRSLNGTLRGGFCNLSYF